MKSIMMVVAAAALSLVAVGSAQAQQLNLTAKAPNLIPSFNVSKGVVTAKNIGSASTKKRSITTIRCTPSAGGTCPEPKPAAAAPYELAAFPNRASVKTPVLAKGASYSHKLKFWNTLKFKPGVYYFTVCVDAGKWIPEMREGDNCRRFRKVVRTVGGLTN